MTERRGEWFLTSSSRQFWPFDPRPEDISIFDIAHALSNVCRFGGHCLWFYSVAQHSVHVSRLVPPEHALVALMHDATEAYVGDMVRPLKRGLPEYCVVEDGVWRAIASRFGFPPYLPLDVKAADNVALMTERRDIVAANPLPWTEHAKPDPEPITPLDPLKARSLFMARFAELGGVAR